jgi:hypothetical protein
MQIKKREEDLKFLTTEQHREAWNNFCLAGLPVGEPDPHQAMVEYLSRGEDHSQRAWVAGCYICLYVVGSAGVVWTYWPYQRVTEDKEAFKQWVEKQFKEKRLILRKERRAVKSAPKLSTSLLSIADWIASELPRLRDTTDYEEVWESVTRKIQFFGRYASIKFIEALRRANCIVATQADIRPACAWSPRLALSAFYPENRDMLVEGDDKPETLRTINGLAHAAKISAENSGCREMTWFELEVLLCNYRQMIHRKYPGSTHDTELGYYMRLYKIWGDELLERVPIFTARLALFNPVCLGELNGWFGGREALEEVFYRYRYHWSDLTYCYEKTADFSQPVRWADLSQLEHSIITNRHYNNGKNINEIISKASSTTTTATSSSSNERGPRATIVEGSFQFD